VFFFVKHFTLQFQTEVLLLISVDLFFLAEVSLKCGDNQVPISIQPSFKCCTDGSARRSVFAFSLFFSL
jgi:hypothetical protein